MAKDVNIHIKTTGADQTKRDLEQVTQQTEQMGGSLSRIGSAIKDAFSALLGPLTIGALVAGAVSGIRKVISAIDDMKKAANDAVNELVRQQQAANSFFEAFGAYGPGQRYDALKMARQFQAEAGLPFESSKALLETYQRTFGGIDQQATRQLAGYWQLHGGTQTADLIRWFGETGARDAGRQGQLLRMIGAISQTTGLRDEELIEAITGNAERMKFLGWSPEQSIVNIGKVIGGLSPAEASRAMRGFFGAVGGLTDEKMKELGAPPMLTTDQARMEWVQKKAAAMPAERQATFMRGVFGAQAPYVSRFMFGQVSPEMLSALQFAASPEGVAAEREQMSQYLGTMEGRVTAEEGRAGPLEFNVTEEQETQALIRLHGEKYLEYLKLTNPKVYYAIMKTHLTEEGAKEKAAEMLFLTGKYAGQPGARGHALEGTIETILPFDTSLGWGGVPYEERLAGVQRGLTIINNYDSSVHYYPSTGDRMIGPRADRTIP